MKQADNKFNTKLNMRGKVRQGLSKTSKYLKTSGKQNIDRKLRRYGVGFSSNGRGCRLVYTIESLPDPFKMYGIVKLGIPAQANFMKIRNLYYFLFVPKVFRTPL